MRGPMGQTLNANTKVVMDCSRTDVFVDTSKQHRNFAENPLEYQKYCKQIEDELNQRFKFILNGTPEAEGAKKVCEQCGISCLSI
jgi:hypothetical protein